MKSDIKEKNDGEEEKLYGGEIYMSLLNPKFYAANAPLIPYYRVLSKCIHYVFLSNKIKHH